MDPIPQLLVMAVLAAVAGLWILNAGVCAELARWKGRNPRGWFVLGLIFGWFATGIVLLDEPTEDAPAELGARREARMIELLRRIAGPEKES